MKIYEDMLRGTRTKKIVLPQPPKEADDDGSQGRHRSAKNGTSLTASNKGGIVGGGHVYGLTPSHNFQDLKVVGAHRVIYRGHRILVRPRKPVGQAEISASRLHLHHQ